MTVITEGPENYLRAIYELTVEAGRETASTSALAESLGVRAASVTGMLKKMAAARPQLVQYHPYRGARLTSAGLQAGLRVVRQHRLLELYLTEALGFGWDQVHSEADRLEHHISPFLEGRIADALGHPDTDPHGAPIPAPDGRVPATRELSLASLQPGAQVCISRVPDRDPDLLRSREALGMTPGVEIELIAISSDGEALIRLPSGSSFTLDPCIAEVILTV